MIYIADDLAWNSIGYEDFDLSFTTPFLTKLAKKGLVMSNYYSQEVCTPARTALLTGRYPIRTGTQYYEVTSNNRWGLNLTEILLPEILRDEGYTTYMLGKWNIGHYSPHHLPTARGFDFFLGYLGGQSYYWSKRDPTDSVFKDLLYANIDCYAPYNGSDVHKYSTFLYRDKAVDIIENHDYSNSPMFLYLAFQAVHDPYEVNLVVIIVVGDVVDLHTRTITSTPMGFPSPMLIRQYMVGRTPTHKHHISYLTSYISELSPSME